MEKQSYKLIFVVTLNDIWASAERLSIWQSWTILDRDLEFWFKSFGSRRSSFLSDWALISNLSRTISANKRSPVLAEHAPIVVHVCFVLWILKSKFTNLHVAIRWCLIGRVEGTVVEPLLWRDCYCGLKACIIYGTFFGQDLSCLSICTAVLQCLLTIGLFQQLDCPFVPLSKCEFICSIEPFYSTRHHLPQGETFRLKRIDKKWWCVLNFILEFALIIDTFRMCIRLTSRNHVGSIGLMA